MPGNSDNKKNIVDYIAYIVISIILALLLWVGNSVQSQSIKLVEMSGTIQLVEQKVTVLQAQLDKADQRWYSAAAAIRDKELILSRVDQLENRIKRIEERKH